MSEHPIEKGVIDVVRTYELLDRVRTRQDLVIRDDQFDFTALIEAALYADRRGIRLSLLDTGRFGLEEVESLARAGSRILTSDEARPRADEWEIIQRASREAGTRLSVLWNGPLPAGDQSGGFSSQTLENLLRSGVDFHISNREHPRDAAALTALAAAAKKGRAFFVAYHIGPLVAELAEQAAGRAWIHFSDTSVADEPAAALAVEIARAAAGSGSRVAVHIERGLPLELLEELWVAGAVLFFLTPPSDDRSLLRPVETKAARRKLPARAYWLSTAFMP
ncbi:MAG: hypothetical protein ACXWHI_01290 [Candidatus Aminicenantales bacterium]